MKHGQTTALIRIDIGGGIIVTSSIANEAVDELKIAAGDHVTAIDGLPVAPLGVDGAVAKIRGVIGTTLAVTLRRGDQSVTLVVERRKMRA